MSAFNIPEDIANRALQHIGGRRIVSLAEDSKNASEIAACYDRLREAELRRNVWRFATRRAVMRPIDTTTTLFTPATWLIGTTYAVGAIVTYAGQAWQTTVASTGQAPGLSTSPWDLYFGPLTISVYDSTVAYYAGELVLSSATVYLSLVSSNADVPPTAKWLSLGATSGPLTILYPIGSGPSNQSATRNVFRLPSNFLREAPQDPKAGSVSFLGAPSGLGYNDWEFESDYLVSREVFPIVYRFVADITGVQRMDAMFCEGLAARIAVEVCEPITQSTEKVQRAASAYQKFMGEARIVNGIETGSTEPPEDDFITCRI